MNQTEYDALVARSRDFLNQEITIKIYDKNEKKNVDVVCVFVGDIPAIGLGEGDGLKYNYVYGKLRTPDGKILTDISLKKIVDYFEAL